MYKLKLLILLLVSAYSLEAQESPCLDCYDNPLDATLSYPDPCGTPEYEKSILTEINSRNTHYDFHYTMRKIQNPSTISGLGLTNYKWNVTGYQKKPFILDGILNMPIAIQGPRVLGINTFHAIPKFKFRIFQNDEDFPYGNGDSSSPVRTPSAMPGMAWYWTKKSWWKINSDDDNPKSKYLGIYAYHHSNGQDGPELDTLRLGEINTYNGNFGEQIIIEFIYGGQIKFTPEQYDFYGDENELKKVKSRKAGNVYSQYITKRSELYWKASYEYHPGFLSNEVFKELNTYGRHRLNFNLSYLQLRSVRDFISDGQLWCQIAEERSFEKFRHTLDFSYIIDSNYNRGNFTNPDEISFIDISKRLNINYTIYRVIQRTQNFALFAQIGYNGSDRYNIYFNDSYINLRAGLAFAFFDQPNNSNLFSLINPN